MKDKKTKFEDIEDSHTLDGSGGKTVCRGERIFVYNNR
jgi:hypothetical protein